MDVLRFFLIAFVLFAVALLIARATTSGRCREQQASRVG